LRVLYWPNESTVKVKASHPLPFTFLPSIPISGQNLASAVREKKLEFKVAINYLGYQSEYVKKEKNWCYCLTRNNEKKERIVIKKFA
jgi:hypothetical protein